MQWKHHGSPTEEILDATTGWKIMSVLFWDFEANFIIDCIPMVMSLGIYKRSSSKNDKGR
jgi:hypothetical protein